MGVWTDHAQERLRVVGNSLSTKCGSLTHTHPPCLHLGSRFTSTPYSEELTAIIPGLYRVSHYTLVSAEPEAFSHAPLISSMETKQVHLRFRRHRQGRNLAAYQLLRIPYFSRLCFRGSPLALPVQRCIYKDITLCHPHGSCFHHGAKVALP